MKQLSWSTISNKHIRINVSKGNETLKKKSDFGNATALRVANLFSIND
jgi:hypothetical protein